MVIGRALLAGLLLVSAVSSTGRAGEVDDMMRQLLPSTGAEAGFGNTVLSADAVTKAGVVTLLGDDASARQRDANVDASWPVLFAPGHESEALTLLQKLPAVQIAIAFQGSSDSLSPETGPLLATLSESLTDPTLRRFKFVVGVHTDAPGSDNYNLSLSSLRAAAIVDALVTAYGLPRDRLFAIGLGRLVNPTINGGTSKERMRLVNLGVLPGLSLGDRTPPPFHMSAEEASVARSLGVDAASKAAASPPLADGARTQDAQPGENATQPVSFSPGNEGEALAALRNLRSTQVALTFEGSSDALSPDAGKSLGTLGQVLSAGKLGSYRFVVGVHTNVVGSDDFNMKLSGLRARAIVDALVTCMGWRVIA